MAQIKEHNGRPAIFIDGKPYPPMMATIRTMKNCNEIIFDEKYFRDLGEAGVKIYFLICDTLWLKPNALELFDYEARALLKAVPDAYIVPRIGLHPTNEWIAANPDECVRYSDGSSPGVHLFTESYVTDLPMHYSLLSSKWRKDAGNALRETWEKILALPYADRIIGCFLAAGGTSEWYYLLETHSPRKGICLDHSPAFKREFTNYLTEVYGTDENLRRYWKNPDATLIDPPIPEFEKHYFSDMVDTDSAIPKQRMYTYMPLPAPPGNGTNRGAFPDFDKNIDIYDFYRAWHLGSANSVLHFAKIIKEMSPEMLVGAFYGSQGCIGFVRSGSNGGTLKLLDSNLVDFLAAPGVYENRLPGGCVGQREVQDSFALRNKIYIVEDDTRTHAENRYFMDKYQIYDMQDSINVMKREFGRTICEDVQAWWFDQLIGGKRYKYPEIISLIDKQQKIASEAYSQNRKKNSEIALIFDEESFQSISYQSTVDLVEKFRNYELARVGAPCDQYYHNDMSNPDMPSYKLYVFMNVFVLTDEEREAIKAKLRRDKAVALWIYGSGVIDPTKLDGRFSAANIEALTGIKMTSVEDKFDGVFRWNGEPHEISSRLGDRALYGKFDRRRIMSLPAHNDPVSRWDTYLYPLFHSVDPEAKNLAYFLTSGYPAVSIKECDGYTSIFYGSKSLKSEVLREIARYAGAHIYLDSDDVTYVNANYITLHSSEKGEKLLKFPYKVSLYEVYEDRFYAKGVTELKVDTEIGDTKMFRVIKED